MYFLHTLVHLIIKTSLRRGCYYSIDVDLLEEGPHSLDEDIKALRG